VDLSLQQTLPSEMALRLAEDYELFRYRRAMHLTPKQLGKLSRWRVDLDLQHMRQEQLEAKGSQGRRQGHGKEEWVERVTIPELPPLPVQ
jgi:hypothetical protein